MISTRWLPNPNQGRTHIPIIPGAHMNGSFMIKVRILVLIEWSYKPPPPNQNK